jgi:hypothetical protein
MKPLHACMVDRNIFGDTFAGPTFEAWRAVAKILDGLPLTDPELALYRLLTQRDDLPTAPFTEAYLIKPRRSGGTLFFACLGLHASLTDYRDKLGPGEYATVALIASDRQQARQLMNYIKGLIEASPMIGAEVEAETLESITFKHRVRLEVHTTSFRSTRGYSYAAVILDELAYFRDDLSANPDVELIRAVRPGLANLRGRLIGLSSPHARRGHLFEMWREYYGVNGAQVLVMQAQEPAILNPTIDPDIIARAMAEDPEAARSEWYGQFRSDVSQYLPDALIDAAVVEGRVELAHVPNQGYVAFVDVSGGVSDASVLGIAHKEPGTRRENLVLDQLIIAKAPHEPHEVVARFGAVLQRFGIRRITGDRYGANWVTNAFKHVGVIYEPSELDKSAIYGEVSALFAEKRVELLDDKRLITELRLLERRPRSGGRGDSVDHPPRAHDDCANAACGALWLASTKKAYAAGNRSRPEYSIV